MTDDSLADPALAGQPGAGPLAGIRVVDLSSLLPGPLAAETLAEAGAEVLKIEPPGGDGVFGLPAGPVWGGAAHALLNRGKRVVRLDLKSGEGRAELRRALEGADVLIEQFRPGVMARLGFDFATVSGWNPRLVYCSITGYGQEGPAAGDAGHDLNYVAAAGLLAEPPPGTPADAVAEPPPVLAADIGGGTLPALVNILLALWDRQRTGRGRHLDIAMATMVRAFAFPHRPTLDAFGALTPAGMGGLTGGSARYAVYPTADGRRLAVAALEPKFWDNVCRIIGLPEALRDDSRDPAATRRAVAERLLTRTAADWMTAFGGDTCVSPVRTAAEALAGEESYPMPLVPGLRRGR
ncbi:crotonobetainyl-CoA:carnitine CoA-transferase CaiB-like acyl-CoA transferase [Azospirillum agricola]|uniref:CaiB/BaiF CoA transferase family protein n=1 Tax=Azospirillum agricola TaxID=1720247 RepID=UPI001AE3E961|nr:CaiB/BaiF CoA-transferase family protein [Azospirillum agricola]MBP2232894.1 crotonobetainyl-CoA:carnitine CoA-transferase CaiB-like acyl-CoA transferase [Azospirillum agricola]